MNSCQKAILDVMTCSVSELSIRSSYSAVRYRDLAFVRHVRAGLYINDFCDPCINVSFLFLVDRSPNTFPPLPDSARLSRCLIHSYDGPAAFSAPRSSHSHSATAPHFSFHSPNHPPLGSNPPLSLLQRAGHSSSYLRSISILLPFHQRHVQLSITLQPRVVLVLSQ